MKRPLVTLLLSLSLAYAPMASAHGGASELSTLSALPVAVSVVAPLGLLVSGAALTVVAVEAASGATVWVLERASDGVRASVQLAAGASVAVGASVVVSAVAAGWVLSVAGEAIAFVPNALGQALLYNERITR
jgi:hypothetical protein